MIELIKPEIIGGISVCVSESLMRQMKVEAIKPYYPSSECRIGSHRCPVVLSGMVFGFRTMDRWSQASLRACIAQLIQKGNYYREM